MNSSLLCVFLCLTLNKSLTGLSLPRTLVKLNTIKSEETNLWSSDDETSKVTPTKSPLLSILSKASSFPSTNGDEKLTDESKNKTKSVPFTKVEALLTIDDGDSDGEDEEGVGPALAFDYEAEFSDEPSLASLKSNYFDNESDLKVGISDLKPVYVKPPTGFQPVIHATRTMDGVRPALSGSSSILLPPPPKPYPYVYPLGLSSWLLGGIRAIERTGFWESLGSDTALNLPEQSATPIAISEWIDLGPKGVISDATKEGEEKLESFSSLASYQPPLPPPSSLQHPSISPWLFGGIHKVNSPIWPTPPHVIEKLEFVPVRNELGKKESSVSVDQSSFVPYWLVSSSSPSSSQNS